MKTIMLECDMCPEKIFIGRCNDNDELPEHAKGLLPFERWYAIQHEDRKATLCSEQCVQDWLVGKEKRWR